MERVFLLALIENPEDKDTLSVFCDWLEDQDREEAKHLKRKLKARWTAEASDDLRTQHTIVTYGKAEHTYNQFSIRCQSLKDPELREKWEKVINGVWLFKKDTTYSPEFRIFFNINLREDIPVKELHPDLPTLWDFMIFRFSAVSPCDPLIAQVSQNVLASVPD